MGKTKVFCADLMVRQFSIFPIDEFDTLGEALDTIREWAWEEESETLLAQPILFCRDSKCVATMTYVPGSDPDYPDLLEHVFGADVVRWKRVPTKHSYEAVLA